MAGRYRAIERVTAQDALGRTVVIQPGGSTDDPVVVAGATESFEDTKAPDELVEQYGPGTSKAEQKGLDSEGASTIEQGDLNRAMVENDSPVPGVFGVMVPDPANSELVSSGAPVGSKEDLEDQARFAEAQETADTEAAERAQARAEDNAAAASEQADAAAVANPTTRTTPASRTAAATPPAKAGKT